MRPQSIVTFERLFLASLAISVLNFILAYGKGGDARIAGLGPGAVIGLFLVSLAIYLLLWFLVARKASNIAKWFLVVIFVLSLTALPGQLAGPLGLNGILELVTLALQLAAIVYLFRGDAAAWLSGNARAA